jgi:hypothetical protein
VIVLLNLGMVLIIIGLIIGAYGYILEGRAKKVLLVTDTGLTERAIVKTSQDQIIRIAGFFITGAGVIMVIYWLARS